VATRASSRRSARGSTPAVSAELIHREAIRLFGEKGYPVVGMRDLSEAVGILPGSLYTHIRSKEELLLEIVTVGIGNYVSAIAPIATAEAPAAERLRDSIKAHLHVLARTLEQTRVTFDQWVYLSPKNRERVVRLRQEYEDLFIRILQDGIKEGTFRPVPHRKVVVLSIIGALNSATEWYSPTGTSTADEIADALADHALNGVTVHPKRPVSGRSS
jgi:AcrR family transcriptional regulator